MTLTPADVRDATFPASSRLRRGYDADEVDAFVERIAVRLQTGDGLTSNDVYHVPFGKARVGGRGYAVADVDAFLERVHGELSRLEESWTHATPAAPDEATDDGAAAAVATDPTDTDPAAGDPDRPDTADR